MKCVTQEKWNRVLKKQSEDFLGGPVAKTPYFQCILRSHMLRGMAKKKKKKGKERREERVTVALGLSNDSGLGGSLFPRTSLLSEYCCEKLVQTTAIIQTQIMGNVSPASIPR